MQLVVTMILIQNSCCGEMYAESGTDPNTQLPGVPEIPPRLNTEVQHLSHSIPTPYTQLADHSPSLHVRLRDFRDLTAVKTCYCTAGDLFPVL